MFSASSGINRFLVAQTFQSAPDLCFPRDQIQERPGLSELIEPCKVFRMAEQTKKQVSIPWLTPEQAADFLKEIRESMGKRVDRRENFVASELPRAHKDDAHSDMLGI